MIGFPYCLLIFLAAARPEWPDITGETARSILPIPIGIGALAIFFLVLGRSGGHEDRNLSIARGWALAFLMASLLMGLLLLTESPY